MFLLIGFVISILLILSHSLVANEFASSSPLWLDINDKLLHFVAYFCATVFGAAIARGKYSVLTVAMFAFGLAIEVLQHYLPGTREFDIFDIVANLIGILTAVALAIFARKLLKPLPSEES